MQNKKELSRLKRHRRCLLRISGSEEIPRLFVYRSLKNLHLQLIDDSQRKTLFSISTLDKEIKQKFPCGGNVKAAEFLGEVAGRRIKEKGIGAIVFDRAGYLYHGRVRALAENLRKAGLKF